MRNTIAILEICRNRAVHYVACIQVNGRYVRFSSMSEAGVRTWLAQQGIPFRSQPELTIARG